jgi:predicted alpha/beta superfamily hydrolase
MKSAVRIHVNYPSSLGRIVLRSDADWDRDIEPSKTAGDTSRFELPVGQTHAYFKPIRISRDGERRWAEGDNLLALAGTAGASQVFPFFEPDPSCSVCNLADLPGATAPRPHRFRVFLPPGYHENTLERFPVLYMQDGQNLFFPSEAFGGRHWKVEETLKVLTSMNLIRRAIVVGVYPDDRTADYTLPGYAGYGRYLADELVPWIDANYRTLPVPAHRALMGSSLGGVVSFFLAWERPDVFGNAACLSSTFGFRDDLFDRVAREPARPLRIYLDSGWPRDNYEATRAMRNLLKRRGWDEGGGLLYLAYPGAAHNEESWAMRAHIPFQFFFGAGEAAPLRAAGSRP